MNDLPFYVVEPAAESVPLVLSLPHCGTAFPTELADAYKPDLAAAPDDTDWFLDKLYDFAPALGVTTICPIYSRWVIDLNREPSSTPLYDDGRIITALCPTSDFSGNRIYKDERTDIRPVEVERRRTKYFWPYHNKIDEICSEFINRFGLALFWDGHSIRRNVRTIQKDPFPDFILGDNDGETAAKNLIETALSGLSRGNYSVTHNAPFKGGFLTRSKGDPNKDVHALQLEMSKDLYMTNGETVYSVEKAARVKEHLSKVFESLIAAVGRMS